jgi:hypothetical protein
VSTLKSNNEKKAYQVYVTDALMAIAENTTHLVGAQGVVDYGRTITQRWIDVINPAPVVEQPEDNRPSEDIAADIWDRIRGH